MIDNVTLNEEQALYVLKCTGGYSCLGFDYAYEKASKIAKHYGIKRLIPIETNKGTMQGYAEYLEAVAYAMSEHGRTGLQCPIGLNAQLIGFERKRVEVVYQDGRKERFIVGKSTGWIPCHLQLKTARSIGGEGISENVVFKSVREIRA